MWNELGDQKQQEEAKERNEGDDRIVERPGGSKLKRATVRGTNEEISEEEKENVILGDEDGKVFDSGRGLEVDAEEADDAESEGRESRDPSLISLGPHSMFLFSM